MTRQVSTDMTRVRFEAVTHDGEHPLLRTHRDDDGLYVRAAEADERIAKANRIIAAFEVFFSVEAALRTSIKAAAAEDLRVGALLPHHRAALDALGVRTDIATPAKEGKR